jgi:hypothetical protein
MTHFALQMKCGLSGMSLSKEHGVRSDSAD